MVVTHIKVAKYMKKASPDMIELVLKYLDRETIEKWNKKFEEFLKKE